MKHSYIAFLLSFIIYTFLLIGIYLLMQIKPPKKEKQFERTKINLKELSLKKNEIKKTYSTPLVRKKKIRKIKKTAKIKKIKSKNKKVNIRKKPIVYKVKTSKTTPLFPKPIKKPIKKQVIKKLPIKKDFVKVIPKKIPKENSKLYNALLNAPTKKFKKSKSFKAGLNKNIQELYGDIFKTLSQSQQDYINNKQVLIQAVTQTVLNRVGATNIPNGLRFNGANTVEFTLYPDGSISDIIFLQKAGFRIIDNTSKETIEIAYKDYPLPYEATLIRFYIYYNLNGY